MGEHRTNSASPEYSGPPQPEAGETDPYSRGWSVPHIDKETGEVYIRRPLENGGTVHAILGPDLLDAELRFEKGKKLPPDEHGLIIDGALAFAHEMIPTLRDSKRHDSKWWRRFFSEHKDVFGRYEVPAGSATTTLTRSSDKCLNWDLAAPDGRVWRSEVRRMGEDEVDTVGFWEVRDNEVELLPDTRETEELRRYLAAGLASDADTLLSAENIERLFTGDATKHEQAASTTAGQSASGVEDENGEERDARIARKREREEQRRAKQFETGAAPEPIVAAQDRTAENYQAVAAEPEAPIFVAHKQAVDAETPQASVVPRPATETTAPRLRWVDVLSEKELRPRPTPRSPFKPKPVLPKVSVRWTDNLRPDQKTELPTPLLQDRRESTGAREQRERGRTDGFRNERGRIDRSRDRRDRTDQPRDRRDHPAESRGERNANARAQLQRPNIEQPRAQVAVGGPQGAERKGQQAARSQTQRLEQTIASDRGRVEKIVVDVDSDGKPRSMHKVITSPGTKPEIRRLETNEEFKIAADLARRRAAGGATL